MLANCCALIPVSLRIVGASAARMVRWKKDNHEHAAIAIHGTHMCQVARSTGATSGAVFVPTVDITWPLKLLFCFRWVLNVSHVGPLLDIIHGRGEDENAIIS